LNWNSNLNPFCGLKEIRELHYCTAGHQPHIWPRFVFGPLAGPVSRPRRPPTTRRARAAARWGHPLRHADVGVVTLAPFSFAGVERGKPRAPVMAPSRRVPRGLPSHRRRPRTPAPPAISSRRRRLWNLSNPSRPGEPNPLLTYPQPEERGKKRRRGSQEQRRHRGAVPAPPPRRRSCPRGGAGPAGATNAFDLGLLDFLAAVPLCDPYQRRLLPLHSTARRHRRQHFGQRPPR
jgi:hypothetical protein